MSRLSRAVDSQRAVIEAHQRDLRQRVARFNDTLGDRAARPGWLAAAFGAGLLGGLSFGRRRGSAPRDQDSRASSSWFSELIRDFGVPFAMNLLQQYMAQRAETEEPPPDAPDDGGDEPPPPGDG